MRHCMTGNLVWLVHNGRSGARLYEQSFPPPSSQYRGEGVGEPKGVKTLWTGISPIQTLEDLTA